MSSKLLRFREAQDSLLIYLVRRLHQRQTMSRFLGGTSECLRFRVSENSVRYPWRRTSGAVSTKECILVEIVFTEFFLLFFLFSEIELMFYVNE